MADSNNNDESRQSGGTGKNKSEFNTNGTSKTTATTTTRASGSEETDADDWLDDATGSTGPTTTPAAAALATVATKTIESEVDSQASVADPLESSEREEELHRQRYKARHKGHHNHRHHQNCHQQHQQKHHHHHHHQAKAGHIKELIKPDPTVRYQRARIIKMSATSPARSPPLVADSSKVIRTKSDSDDPNANSTISVAFRTPPSSRVAVVVDEEQLQERFRESISEKNNRLPGSAAGSTKGATCRQKKKEEVEEKNKQKRPAEKDKKSPRRSMSSSSSSSSNSHSNSNSNSNSSHSHSSSSHGADADDGIDGMRSPPPAAIIIPASVAKSLSHKASMRRNAPGQSSQSPGGGIGSQGALTNQRDSSSQRPHASPNAAITREQLQYGPLLKPGEVQILYRSPDADSTSLDRHLKEEQAKLVAPNMRQSPIAIMTMNPTYELQNKPLIIEYPARVENLKLNNTGFSWEVKIPYQISMTTALYGAHLNQSHRYRLDQFHCHWGSDNKQGSEHTVDNCHHSAELHFVHYNMEKYHTMPKAARHPDGLVVLSVFLEASDQHHNHAELEKIVSHLKHVPLKGEHSIIRQAVHIENLLPQNRSYWSYQGSLTTPPYFESVTWFIFKYPIRCNTNQIARFRNLKSSLRADDDSGHHRIDTNHRKTQPLNGRSIVNYDEQPISSSNSNNNNSVSHATTTGSRSSSSSSRGNSSHPH